MTNLAHSHIVQPAYQQKKIYLQQHTLDIFLTLPIELNLCFRQGAEFTTNSRASVVNVRFLFILEEDWKA